MNVGPRSNQLTCSDVSRNAIPSTLHNLRSSKNIVIVRSRVSAVK